MARPVTRRQLEVLQAFHLNQQEQGLAPTLEELGKNLGVNRVTVYGHVQALLQKGLLENLLPGASRGLDLTTEGLAILSPQFKQMGPVVSPGNGTAIPGAEETTSATYSTQIIPFLGKVAAGSPMEAIENRTEIPLHELIPNRQGNYLLEVDGDSMIEAHIAPGDLVMVDRDRPPLAQDIVVAVLANEEATLKRYVPNPDGSAYLVPANASLEPRKVAAGDLEIRGVVTGVVRRYP